MFRGDYESGSPITEGAMRYDTTHEGTRDTREALRRFFETDAASVEVAAASRSVAARRPVSSEASLKEASRSRRIAVAGAPPKKPSA